MSDDADMVFGCDYCSALVDVSRAEVFYRHQRELADGRVLVAMGVYCSGYCGARHAVASVSCGAT